MAAHLSKSELSEASSDDLELNTVDFKPTQASIVQAEELPSLPRTQPGSPSNGNGSRTKQELQHLSEMFHSWLQPDKHSKEMISQLVMVFSGCCKDKSALREVGVLWQNHAETCGDLSDDCLKPLVCMQVSMQGGEALFPEHMSLKEAIMHLKEQRAAKIATEDHVRTAFQTAQDIPLKADLEDD